ncbi:hypothetical protein CLAIMM_00468, partial [Cladophialophora immunda]
WPSPRVCGLEDGSTGARGWSKLASNAGLQMGKNPPSHGIPTNRRVLMTASDQLVARRTVAGSGFKSRGLRMLQLRDCQEIVQPMTGAEFPCMLYQNAARQISSPERGIS